MAHQVRLEWYEVRLAATVGIERRIQSRSQGFKKDKGDGGNADWSMDIEGACAELAVAKFLRRYWQASINDPNGGDVGKIEVRSSAIPDARLILRKADLDNKPERPFVLVTGTAPLFTIQGWILSTEVKNHPEWIQNPNNQFPAWFVPRSALVPFANNITLRSLRPTFSTQ